MLAMSRSSAGGRHTALRTALRRSWHQPGRRSGEQGHKSRSAYTKCGHSSQAAHDRRGPHIHHHPLGSLHGRRAAAAAAAAAVAHAHVDVALDVEAPEQPPVV